MANVFELPARDFNYYLAEQASMGRPQAEIDDLRRRYRDANSFSGKLKGLLEPEEGKRRSTYLPVDAPQGMSIFDAITSGQWSPAIPQGLVDAITGLVRGVESPAEYAKGIPPRADAVGDAFATGSAAMTIGGLTPTPKGAIGANMLRSGKMTDPTETGWTFRDVKVPNLTKEENRKVYEALSVPRGYEVELPIRRLFATQDSVNPDFATTTSSQGRIPTVIRKGGEFFIRDGHHRLTKQAEAGNQNAKVWLYDLDNENRDTPLLDYEAPKELRGERLAEVNRFLDELGLLDDTLAANASPLGGLLAAQPSENNLSAIDSLRKLGLLAQ